VPQTDTCLGIYVSGCHDSVKHFQSNVDENAVECRGYKDFEGLVPGSAPFSVAKPADVSTNLGMVASLLCYFVEV
jgi:hypothetical protein